MFPQIEGGNTIGNVMPPDQVYENTRMVGEMRKVVTFCDSSNHCTETLQSRTKTIKI